jgi:hypothetical protein
MTLRVVLLLMSITSAVLYIKCARFACRRFSEHDTACWLGRIQTTMAVFSAALAVGLYLGFGQHPPIVLALVLLSYLLALAIIVAVVVLGAARSGTEISMQTMMAVGAMILGTTVLVAVNLGTVIIVSFVLICIVAQIARTRPLTDHAGDPTPRRYRPLQDAQSQANS